MTTMTRIVSSSPMSELLYEHGRRDAGDREPERRCLVGEASEDEPDAEQDEHDDVLRG
jgi:hypothetical protein